MALLGAVSGFLAGLLGIGGGIVLVPGLYFMFAALGFAPDHLMHVAVGTSLAVIIPTGLSSVRAHAYRGSVRMDLIKSIGIGIVAGVLMGTLIADSISGQSLKMVFAFALAALAVIMLVDPRRTTVWNDVPDQPWRTVAGAVIGCLSTLMGIGGATVSVPFMTMGRVDMRQAVGTASALGLVISIPAMMGFILIGWSAPDRPPFSLGFVNMLAAIMIIPLAVAFAPLGARVAHAIPVDMLRRVFAVFLIIVAARMMMDVFNLS
ncbi:conserved hypothetical protein [Micavibrio aeruginosavorus ARL-13]|uniref:Probable membrane transporter protein n=1 Tax=Micavibrio aeruginosavorus (strain ARL-13) TaxID=856793 RepID=G2KSA5_MICAA|nr:conserved hypothetical protein [Micavibrio aeruginosavorus ARL-13]